MFQHTRSLRCSSGRDRRSTSTGWLSRGHADVIKRVAKHCVTCPKTEATGAREAQEESGKSEAGLKHNFLVVEFFLPVRKGLLVFVGEKVNSLEKLADVGRIVDRGSCFGRVFCTDATIATVRPARTGGHI